MGCNHGKPAAPVSLPISPTKTLLETPTSPSGAKASSVHSIDDGAPSALNRKLFDGTVNQEATESTETSSSADRQPSTRRSVSFCEAVTEIERSETKDEEGQTPLLPRDDSLESSQVENLADIVSNLPVMQVPSPVLPSAGQEEESAAGLAAAEASGMYGPRKYGCPCKPTSAARQEVAEKKPHYKPYGMVLQEARAVTRKKRSPCC